MQRGFGAAAAVVAPGRKGADHGPVGAHRRLEAGQGCSHLLALGLQAGATGKSNGQGLLKAQAGDTRGLELLGGWQIQRRSRGGLLRLDGPLRRFVGPQEIGRELGGGEHIAHRWLGLGGYELIQRPQLGIQLLPTSLEQLRIGSTAQRDGHGSGEGIRRQRSAAWHGCSQGRTATHQAEGQSALEQCHGGADQRLMRCSLGDGAWLRRVVCAALRTAAI